MTSRGIGFWAAVAIGIGGMVGAGIFSILGVVGGVSGNALWLSFIIGGGVALLSTYSYARLGTTFPSSGGAVEFLVRGYRDGIVSGGLNIFMWVGYVVTLALYASGFAGYASTFFPPPHPPWLSKALAAGVILLFTMINFVGSKLVGRSETAIVAIKLAILGIFSGVGLLFVEAENLDPAHWPAPLDMIVGAGILFVGYEGFGLITNAAGDMRDPRRTLPRALYASVLFVIGIYVLVAVAVLGNLSISQLRAAEDYALAEAARPFLGNAGFELIAVAALFSTASAINATLFGGANVSYMIAREGQLPEAFSRRVWQHAGEGLFITAGLVIVFILLFDLARVAMLGSAAFLLVYAAVNLAHLRLTADTGAKPWIIWMSLLTCLVMFVVLASRMWRDSRFALITLAVALAFCFLAEAAYRRFTGRTLHASSPDLPDKRTDSYG